MNLSAVLRYAKAIVAAVGATAASLCATLPSDPDVQHYGTIAAAAATVLGVLLAKNTPANDLQVLGAVESTGLIPSAWEAKLDQVLALVTPPPAPVGPPDPLLADALAVLAQPVATRAPAATSAWTFTYPTPEATS